MAQFAGLLPPDPKSPAAWQLLRYSQSPLPFLEDCARRYGTPFTVRWAGYGTQEITLKVMLQVVLGIRSSAQLAEFSGGAASSEPGDDTG
ncbi:MAG: hypothetical protein WKF77_17295 [Planctomycetaceae bacterium]